MASRQVGAKHTTFVYKDHRLSRFANHNPPLELPFEGSTIKIPSLALGHAYVMLQIHGQHRLALELARDKSVQGVPTKVGFWLKQQGFVPHARWAFGSRHVYRAILVYLMQQKANSFKREFENLVDSLPKKKPHRFVACCGPRDSDYYWTCGLRYNPARNATVEYPGVNQWGRELDQLLEAYRNQRYVVRFGIDTLLAGTFPESPTPYPRYTMLILADSQMHPMDTVDSGRAISCGGKGFGALARQIREENIDISQYTYLVASAGVNDAQKEEYKQRESWREFWSLIKPYAYGSTPEILVSLAVPHSDAHLKKCIERHSNFITEQLQGTAVKYVSWIDEDNAFVSEDGDQNRRLYEKGGPKARTPYFHINHAGVREMWLEWCRQLPELGHLSYSLRPVNRADPTTLMRSTDPPRQEEDQPGPSGVATSHGGRVYRGHGSYRARQGADERSMWRRYQRW